VRGICGPARRQANKFCDPACSQAELGTSNGARLSERPYVFSALPTHCGIVLALVARRVHFWSAAGSEAPRRFGFDARARPEPCVNTGARRKSKAPSPLRSAGALQNLNARALNTYVSKTSRSGLTGIKTPSPSDAARCDWCSAHSRAPTTQGCTFLSEWVCDPRQLRSTKNLRISQLSPGC
jgi:hypothetical protein